MHVWPILAFIPELKICTNLQTKLKKHCYWYVKCKIKLPRCVPFSGKKFANVHIFCVQSLSHIKVIVTRAIFIFRFYWILTGIESVLYSAVKTRSSPLNLHESVDVSMFWGKSITFIHVLTDEIVRPFGRIDSDRLSPVTVIWVWSWK